MPENPYLDLEKIEQESKWDGFFGIQTNCSFSSPDEILKIYHDLWKIEEAFRVLKSHIETRPIFHWTPKRIKGHITLCFIAFLLERTLELELKKNNISASPDKIREALNSLQVSELIIDKNIFLLRSKVQGLAYNILKSLKIPLPNNISTPKKF